MVKLMLNLFGFNPLCVWLHAFDDTFIHIQGSWKWLPSFADRAVFLTPGSL